MRLSLFDYQLPQSAIAQKPSSPRDHSRLFVYHRKNRKIEHNKFFQITKYLKKDDVLVFNNSKVFPARLYGNKESGGKAEVLLLRNLTDCDWECLLKCRNPKIGLKLRFKRGLLAEVIERINAKTWRLQFNHQKGHFYSILNKIGQVPLPPYIKSTAKQTQLKKQYQSIFAKFAGSAAGPTASFHFTKQLVRRIKKIGCQFEFLTLHIGLGTFEPVNTKKIEDFKIHEEWLTADKKTINRLWKAKQAGKRIVAVGTTAVRGLETIFHDYPNQPRRAFSNFTNIFIYPGYKFRFIDAMITNFHLPKSSLIMLVSAFISRGKTLQLYKNAIAKKYRFYSFGDAMFIK
jgi:S-adenosylmethionine:tRNA ribosyltransferase-isomerase